MDMEQRKVTWQNRINKLLNEDRAYLVDIGDLRLLTSICQDAFNEGHRAGRSQAADMVLANNLRREADDR